MAMFAVIVLTTDPPRPRRQSIEGKPQSILVGVAFYPSYDK